MKCIVYLTSVALLSFTLGCATTGRPPSSKIVGGGAQIAWQPPESGTAILIERVTGKVVITRSVTEHGEPFTFNLTTAEDSAVVEKALGIVPPNPEFVLFFVPSSSSK